MTLSPAPGNLPAEPNSFVGRERDLAELVAILDRGRALTLCGPGGIGKTRLALRLATVLGERFPDGAWIADLADADLDETADAGEQPGPGAPGSSDSGERSRLVGLITAALRILDTCEHLVQECAELVQRLVAGCPGLHVIATSREPLGVRGEIIWRVPPLGLPPASSAGGAGQEGWHAREVNQSEAVQLFVER